MTAQRFLDRSALVTGGASGIGRATALALAREGARVMIADIDEAGGRDLEEEIRASGGVAVFMRADATEEADVAAMVAAAAKAHGSLSLAFNNIGLSRAGDIETMTLENWNWTVSISLTSTWLAMKHEIPMMRANGGGAIVNTASMAGKRYTAAASPAYSAAKAGVIHLTACAAAAYAAYGVRVNSVSPGLVATPVIARMFDEARQAEIAGEGQRIARAVKPEEIAATALFLLSGEAAMITGTDTEVCGGRR